MQQFHSFAEAASAQLFQGRPVWASIGTFDGVHRGHQAILSPLAREAHAAGAAAAVITFFPHPVVVLRGISEPIYLTSPTERARRIGQLGVDAVITLSFDRALAALSAEEFMQQVTRSTSLKQLWVGSDFVLGRNRQGDVTTLRTIGERMGYRVKVVEEVTSGRERISSSHIRRLVRAGQVSEAASLLGQPYCMEGPVIHGDGRGRTLGFPTANIQYWKEKIVPAYGVYATWTVVTTPGGETTRLPSVTSVGVRPTFDPPGAPPRVEAFLIDYNGDLYGQTARVEFLEFLRPELRFESVQALIDQMILDTQRAKEVLANAT